MGASGPPRAPGRGVARMHFFASSRDLKGLRFGASSSLLRFTRVSHQNPTGSRRAAETFLNASFPQGTQGGGEANLDVEELSNSEDQVNFDDDEEVYSDEDEAPLVYGSLKNDPFGEFFGSKPSWLPFSSLAASDATRDSSH